jgi:hypothetical protein
MRQRSCALHVHLAKETLIELGGAAYVYMCGAVNNDVDSLKN